MLMDLEKQIKHIIDKVVAEKEKEIAEKYEAIYKDKIEKELHRIEMRCINNTPHYASIGNAKTPKQY